MIKEPRVGVDWSKHKHRVEIFKNQNDEEIRVDHFQVDNSNIKYIQFINTNRTLSITGDYGNWIFCRPFIPSNDGFVSDSYWIEKLKISSEQKLNNDLDWDYIQTEIKSYINGGLEEYGFEGDELEKSKEYFNELLDVAKGEDKLEYEYFAFRDSTKPNFIDYDLIPHSYETPIWLKIIFDAFDEICKRLKNEK